MVRKVLVGVLAAALLLPLGTTSALAATSGHRWNFVDEDGDGICDNYADGNCQGNGYCQGNGNCQGNRNCWGNRNYQGSKRNNNPVKASKRKLSLKKGKSFRLNAKNVRQSKNQGNNKESYYESSNPKVATVSQKGVIRAKKKGKCTIYAYVRDRICSKVKVTVP